MDRVATKQEATALAGSMKPGYEYLAFRLGSEEYGIHIEKVGEIRSYDTVTRIANSPDFIKGVINLRGVIVPIVDLRIKFGMAEPVYDAFTVVIILDVGGKNLGVVVDGVSDVVTLLPDDIRPAPEMAAKIDMDCLQGIGTIDGRMLILLDIDRLMSQDDIGLLRSATAR